MLVRLDVEWPQHHPNLLEARELAVRHDIRLAVSNPCCELWLILHLQKQSGFLTTAQAEHLSRGLDGRRGKGIDPDLYLPHRGTAIHRAVALTQRHSGNGTEFPNNNPSSTMSALLTAIDPTLPDRRRRRHLGQDRAVVVLGADRPRPSAAPRKFFGGSVR